MIRRATIDDVNGIFVLMRDYINPSWSEEVVKATLLKSENDNFVYCQDANIIGYIFIENVLDEGCLTSIAVKDSYRRKGIAGALITHALSVSKMKSIYLEVEDNNLSAICLYKKFGFVEIGRRRKYYGDNDAIILRKELF
ncbi:MAG: ribosomal protein S18-alanine N-acetyltransferase [Clostridia bacterium]|nr:ribosomal protein S18-alanine N-acetyltransferase [Clostridia bacterium]